MTSYEGMSDNDISIISYDISVIPNDFNVLTITNLLDNGVISMPSFQRSYVWDKKRASKFIESLILGLPIPQIFLYQQGRNRYSVIDGQQRLMSIYYFTKQRFPKPGKRAFLRKLYAEKGVIPEDILYSSEYFQEFKLLFPKQESGEPHPLNGKSYKTLDENQRSSFELMPIRCMSIRQNKPDDDGSSIYEIFSRLNTGGLNLSPQEIRICLYDSPFYKMLYDLNTNSKWRALLGKPEEDDKFRDIEIVLRSFALLFDKTEYSGSMVQFLNRFSNKAKSFSEEEINQCHDLFIKCLDICGKIDRKSFLTNNGGFNAAFFDSVFVAISERLMMQQSVQISQKSFDKLRNDEAFIEAITHSTSHVDNVKKRLELAKAYLFE